MNVAFTLNGVILDEQERDYVVRKLESVAAIANNVQRADVEIKENKRNDYFVEAVIITDRNEYRATEVAATIAAAIDIMEDELKSQIRDDKKRRETMTRRGARSIKKKLTLSQDSRL
jgi:ribosomal subunit interface protein